MILTLTPQIRNSSLENLHPEEFVLYFDKRAELDDDLLATHGRVLPFTMKRFRGLLGSGSCHVLEISEPMWLTQWPRTFALAAFAKLYAKRIEGPTPSVVTYALENLDFRSRFTLPALDRWPRLNSLFASAVRLLMAPTLRVLDAIAFGSDGARANFAATFPRTASTVEMADIDARLAPCPCFGHASAPRATKERMFVFLGEASERKGVTILRDAWTQSGLGSRGWKLQLVGPGFTAVDRGDVECRSALPRTEIHSLLRIAAVIVLPSRRVPRWREQVGLPLIEALTHGCRVITTSESGVATGIAQGGFGDVIEPGAVPELTRALERAADYWDSRTLDDSLTLPETVLPGYLPPREAKNWFSALPSRGRP